MLVNIPIFDEFLNCCCILRAIFGHWFVEKSPKWAKIAATNRAHRIRSKHSATKRTMNQIEEEDSSPFCKQTLRLKVSLLPSSLRDVRSSIEKNINQMLFTYNSTCQGVMLAYDDLKILDQGKILNEFPHIHYRSVSLLVVTWTTNQYWYIICRQNLSSTVSLIFMSSYSINVLLPIGHHTTNTHTHTSWWI